MEPALDFSWLPQAGLTFEQYSVQTVERVCSGAPLALLPQHQHCPPPATLELCARFVEQVVRRVAAGNLTLHESEELVREADAVGVDVTVAASTLRGLALQERLALRRLLVHEALAQLTALKHFDWNVKLSVSSSRVLELQEPLLTLLLHTTVPQYGTAPSSTRTDTSVSSTDTADSSNTATSGAVFTELSLTQLDDLIEKLKNAQNKMAKFK